MEQIISDGESIGLAARMRKFVQTMISVMEEISVNAEV